MKQGKTIIRTTLGDITKIAGMDAIVNAANHELSIGTGGVNWAVHKAAGPGLNEECKALNGCNVGDAKITSAYNLPCKYIIHTVGPVWVDGYNHEAEELRRSYKSCLEIACEKHIRKIAFSSISTGLHYIPLKLAADNAINSVGEFVASHPDVFDEIVWVLYSGSIKSYYDAALAEWEKNYVSKVKETSEKSGSIEKKESTALTNEENIKSEAKISAVVPSPAKVDSFKNIELHCPSVQNVHAPLYISHMQLWALSACKTQSRRFPIYRNVGFLYVGQAVSERQNIQTSNSRVLLHDYVNKQRSYSEKNSSQLQHRRHDYME